VAEVACAHLVKEYAGGVRGLDDVSLTIADGEMMVLVGPSGCGKSTLLRTIAGLEQATSGTVSIGGRDVTHLSPQERNVAMVFQDYALYPHMTVRRNLEFPLRMRRMDAAQMHERVSRVAELLGLAQLMDRLPKQLSGGQRQRVAMGRALVREPSVSLLDEPLSNLDAKLRVQVRAEIGELQRRTATTMIYVTHDQVEAMTLGDRVCVLDRGRIQQVAPPAELYDHPANAFVAGFIGNPPMNLLPATIGTADGSLSVRIGQASMTLPAASIGRDTKDLVHTKTLGVRPEAVDVVAADARDGSVEGVVEHVELLGHETLVHAAIGAGSAEKPPFRVVARVPGTHAPEHGQRVGLAMRSDALHFFAEDGAVIR